MAGNAGFGACKAVAQGGGCNIKVRGVQADGCVVQADTQAVAYFRVQGQEGAG